MTKRNALLERGIVSLAVLSLTLSLGAPLSTSAQLPRVSEKTGVLQDVGGSLRLNQAQVGLGASINPSFILKNESPVPAPAPGENDLEAEVSMSTENIVLAAEGNLIANPSLENGSTVPTYWQKGSWGTNTAVFKYPVAGYRSSRSAWVNITSYTSGDAKWFFNDVAVAEGSTYTFSDYYKSNIPSYVTIRYQLVEGSYQYVGLASLPSSANIWKKFAIDFAVPANVQKLTIFHLIQQVGTLRVDQFSLAKKSGGTPPPPPGGLEKGMVTLAFDDGWMSAYQNAMPIIEAAGYKSTHYINSQPWKEDFDGYMQESQILDLQNRGHEVGAHTRTHADLTQLSEAEIRREVKGNRDDLLALGIKKVDTFAYPYGSYNEKVKQIVKETGFKTARSIHEGLNMKGVDPYLLNWQGPESHTTVAQMKQWIDQAINQKGWLILSFHEILNNGGQYSNTPQSLKEVVDYLKQKNVRVVTVSEGAALLGL